MSSFTTGDIFFIILILCFIHGIMLVLGYVRRRKARRNLNSEGESPPL